MKIICKLFGHTVAPDGLVYMATPKPQDGAGQRLAAVGAHCRRCGVICSAGHADLTEYMKPAESPLLASAQQARINQLAHELAWSRTRVAELEVAMARGMEEAERQAIAGAVVGRMIGALPVLIDFVRRSPGGSEALAAWDRARAGEGVPR